MGSAHYWFCWCPRDYWGETPHLTADEDLAMRRLIDVVFMRGGSVDDNDSQIARSIRFDVGRWKTVRPAVEPYFDLSTGVWRHQKVDAHLKKAERLHESRSLGARLTNAKRDAERIANRSAERDAERIAGRSVRPESQAEEKETPSFQSGEKKDVLPQAVEPAGLNPPNPEQLNGAGRGARLPLDWRPDEADREYASKQGLDPDDIAEQFRDFWFAKAGAGARKRDWHATWRTWCRTEAARLARQSHGGARAGGDRPRTAGFPSALRRAFPDVN